jgi:DNA-binding PadR family transcriptional regulator
VNATAASLLGLLDISGGELTGGELVRLAQDRIGDFWTLTRSQVYREIAALEEEGHIERGELGPRESRPYRVTDAGRATYRSWLTENLPAETVRIPILLAVAFGSVLPSDKVRTVLREAEAEHRRQLAEYRELDGQLMRLDVDAWTRATLSFGLHYEQAVVRWFESLPPDIIGSPADRAGQAAV